MEHRRTAISTVTNEVMDVLALFVNLHIIVNIKGYCYLQHFKMTLDYQAYSNQKVLFHGYIAICSATERQRWLNSSVYKK